jgi:hypothetical protein
LFQVDDKGLSERKTLSAFSGLVVLGILLAMLAASTLIASGEGAATHDAPTFPPRTFRGDQALGPSTTFYLLNSDAQAEELREVLELAADQGAHTPLPYYPHVVTLVAGTPDEEAVAYARIVEHLRFGKGKPESIEVVDLRMQETE